MVKYWLLSRQGLQARARSFVEVMQDTVCPGTNQSFWQGAPKKKRARRRKRNQTWWSYIHNQVLQACRAERGREGWAQISPTMAPVNMNTNDVFIERECSANHSWRDNSQCLERRMRISVRGSIFHLSSSQPGLRRKTQVMCCVTTQWLFPPAGAITDLVMGSHQSQSAPYSTSVSTLCSSVKGSWNWGNNGVFVP